MTKTLKTIVDALDDKKAQNIISLDLRKIDGAICDFFVICNADSTTQVSALAEGVEKETSEKVNEKPWRVNGRENSVWIAMDYGDIIVHIFQTEMRDYYRLEELWGDAKATRFGE